MTCCILHGCKCSEFGSIRNCTIYCTSLYCADETADDSGLLLTKADESIEKRQRRITQLLHDLPASLKAAQAAETKAAADVKASQAELPSPEKVLLHPLALCSWNSADLLLCPVDP